MATTVSGSKSTEVYNVTLSGTANNVTLLNLPAAYGVLVLYSRTNASKLTFDTSLADDDAIGASAYMTLPADTMVTIPVDGMASAYIASATASNVVEVVWVRG